ncbi:MAG: DUF1992 domain-containing protein [Gaiellales bacterium]|nr:MAG: DUF1992 domain-containing protein [Gaiellales bacterium]
MSRVMEWFERLAEKRILEAQREGAFDDLPGSGRPLPRDRFARLNPELRMAARVLANSGYAPEEVSLLKELAAARQQLGAARTAEERERLIREYSLAELRLNLALERHRRFFG